MPKMLSPVFPPRRPSSIVRYVLVGAVLLMMIYYYRNSPEPTPGSILPPKAVPNPNAGPPPPDYPQKQPTYGSGYGSDPLDRPKAEYPQPRPGTEPEGKSKAGSSSGAHQKWEPDEEGDSGFANSYSPGSEGTGPEDAHPIDRLIYDAQHQFAEIMSKETKSVEEAAQAYRKRRGRHPPPFFDKWFEFAQENNAIIVEDFFDQVYHDLQPFWGLEPSVLRKESWDYEMTIHIRDGKAETTSDWFWTVIWLDLIKTIEHLLPDMDLPLNAMDEPRIIVPWEDMEKYMKKASKTVNLKKMKDVRSDFQKLPEPGTGDLMVETRPKDFEGTKPFWALARRGCAPDSLARTTAMQESFASPPEINMTFAEAHMFEGYVSNTTLATDICHQPDLQGLEGILIEPLSTSTTKVFAPVFGGSKLGVNNEILLPAPMYWNEEERFTGGDDHGAPWPAKENAAIWRGVATGGTNRESNWRGFQRHRFVAMNNGTAIANAELGTHRPENFVLPDEQYELRAQVDGKLGNWVSEWADVAFVDLMCEPPQEDGNCEYTAPFFERKDGMPMAVQFSNKYVPDIDGNSFSGRYLGFLRSTSLPIKATIWREWHDSRLVAWKHFVPMDSRFGDYYGIMDYFLGYHGRGGHDAAAEKIANDGKEWAEKVLRKEDMQVYTLRLLLEYARLLDDRRENLGWVEDILTNPELQKAWSEWR